MGAAGAGEKQDLFYQREADGDSFYRCAAGISFRHGYLADEYDGERSERPVSRLRQVDSVGCDGIRILCDRCEKEEDRSAVDRFSVLWNGLSSSVGMDVGILDRLCPAVLSAVHHPEPDLVRGYESGADSGRPEGHEKTLDVLWPAGCSGIFAFLLSGYHGELPGDFPGKGDHFLSGKFRAGEGRACGGHTGRRIAVPGTG